MGNNNGHNYSSNYSRREFIKLLSLAGASISLIKFVGCSASEETIHFLGTGTLDIGEKWKRVEKELGIKVIFQDNGNDPGPVIANMINGNAAYDFDLGGLQGGAERELAIAKKILPWDLNKIPNWDKTWDWVKNISHCIVDGKQYGLPVVVNADSIIYLPDKVGMKVESYEIIFDKIFKGRTAMEDAWINSAIFAAIYLKENSIYNIDNPGDLTEDELSHVMEFLIKKKEEGQFKTFWRGWEDGVRLIKSGEVYAMTGWEPIVYAAKNAGANVEYAVPREGYEGWSNDLVIHIGAQSRDLISKVHEFANWELNGFYGCELTKQRGYIVPNNLSMDYAKKYNEYDYIEQKNKIEHVKNKFLSSKVYWQNTRPKNYKLYEEWWSKLRTA